VLKLRRSFAGNLSGNSPIFIMKKSIMMIKTVLLIGGSCAFSRPMVLSIIKPIQERTEAPCFLSGISQILLKAPTAKLMDFM
jgi:hypothetical protein